MPALPQLDGVTFRMFAGRGDYPYFARIITAQSTREGHQRVETADSLGAFYDHFERCDPRCDLLIAEFAGTPIGYSRVWWDQEADGPRVYRQVCFLDPTYGGRGIGKAIFDWNDARLHEIADEHDVEDKQLEVFSNDRNLRATALITGAGYEPVAHDAQMVRPMVDDLPDHPLPEGVELRPVTEAQLREIWEADMDAFRDHWGYVEPSEERYQEFLAFPFNDYGLWKIAWDDEGVAGQVKSYINPAENEKHGLKRGWTEAISTSRRWRRRGVAKALIVESIRELAKRGMTEVALGVHTDNPNGAFDLYSSLGYEESTRWTTYRRPL
jgi:mycothiol synthase